MDNFMDALAQKYNAQEMIRANSQADANEMQYLQEQVEAYEAVLQEMRKLNYKNTELTEKMYSLVDESLEKVRTLQIEASHEGASAEQISQEMSEAVNTALGEALNNLDAQVAQSLTTSIAEALSKPTEDLIQSSEIVGSSVANMKDAMGQIDTSAKEIRSCADDIVMAADDIRTSNQFLQDTIKNQAETDQIFNEQLRNSVTQVMENCRQIVSSLEEIKQVSTAALECVQSAPAESDFLDDEPEEQVDVTAEMRDALQKSLQDLEGVVNTIASTVQGSLQTSSDELQTLVGDLNSSVHSSSEEIIHAIRNLKQASDESKNTLKTTIDSSIYSLKQDNKEIVEFVQRMNTGILAKLEDPELEKQKQQEKEEEELRKQELEGRFQANEDFMHKESVKVYRNVQAVVNEKIDKQTSNLESELRQIKSQVGQAKGAAIFATVVGGIGVILQVLRILGII